MLDLNHLRRNFDEVKQRLAARGTVEGLERFHEVDAQRRAAVTEIENLKAKRNSLSTEVAKAKREGGDADEAMQQSREVGGQVKSLEDNVKTLDGSLADILRGIMSIFLNCIGDIL